MRMITTLLVLGTSLMATLPAHAGGTEITQFLTSLDGLWRGTGIYRVISSDGTRTPTGYDLSSEYRSEANKTWYVSNQVRTNRGEANSHSYRLAVRGDSLYIGSPSATEEAEVIASSVDSLTYRLVRVDRVYARVYTYTYETRIRAGRAGGQVVLGRTTIESNGVVVADDQYTIDRF